ncbi:MAG: 2OG-Fe(II) oxygenase [Pseudoxanthomonas sp.]
MHNHDIDIPRPLGVGDYFPDVVFENPAGSVHSAALAGQRIAIVFFPSGFPAARADESLRLLEMLKGLVPTMLAGFPGREGTPVPDPALFHELATPVPESLFIGADNASPKLFLLERDGKISWAGPAFDPESCRSAIAGIVGQDAVGSEPFAPVLVVRDALPPALCQRLIRAYQDSDDKVMGRVGLSNPRFDPSRKRVSHVNLDPETAQAIDTSLVYSLLPMIERCFDFRVTRRVAYKVSLYDSQDQGFFYPHRDNSDPGTDFRRYALSLVLNDDWEGGGLSFPEFGSRHYRLQAGSAIVFPVSLLHQVHPVTAGKRHVLLSFLYAEEGAQLRRSTMKDPGLLDTTYPDAIAPALLRAYDEAFARESRFRPKYGGEGQEPAFVSAWKNRGGA